MKGHQKGPWKNLAYPVGGQGGASRYTCTYTHWATEHCKGDAKVLRELLSSIQKHYSDDQSSCHKTSRCRQDPAYERSRKPVTDTVAMDLLTNAMTKSTFYKFT